MRSAVAYPYIGRLIRRVTCLVMLPATPLLTSSPAWSDVNSPAQSSILKAAPVGALLRDPAALAEWIERRHSDVFAASARLTQARADVDQSRVFLPNPQLDAGIGGIPVGPTNPPGHGFSDTSSYTIGLSQTIEIGKRGPRIEAAELRAAEAKSAYAGAIADKIADARYALARVAYLKGRLALLEENLRSAKRVADLERARLEHGGLSGNDYDRLLLDTLTLETDTTKSQAEYAGAIAVCQAALYAPCEDLAAQPSDIDAAAPVSAAPLSLDLSRRPDIEAIRLESAAAERDAELARRQAIPDPTVRIGYTRDNATFSGAQLNTLAISVTLPLPLFDHGQHAAAKATARAEEQRHLAEALLVGAESGVSALWRRKAAVEVSLQTLRAQALPRSASVLESTLKAFDQGQVSMTDLLLARRTHVTLVLTQMDLRFDFFSVRNDLRRALGLDVMPSTAASNRE